MGVNFLVGSFLSVCYTVATRALPPHDGSTEALLWDLLSFIITLLYTTFSSVIAQRATDFIVGRRAGAVDATAAAAEETPTPNPINNAGAVEPRQDGQSDAEMAFTSTLSRK